MRSGERSQACMSPVRAIARGSGRSVPPNAPWSLIASMIAEEEKTVSPEEKTTRPPPRSTVSRSAANRGSLLCSYSAPFTYTSGRVLLSRPSAVGEGLTTTQSTHESAARFSARRRSENSGRLVPLSMNSSAVIETISRSPSVRACCRWRMCPGCTMSKQPWHWTTRSPMRRAFSRRVMICSIEQILDAADALFRGACLMAAGDEARSRGLVGRVDDPKTSIGYRRVEPGVVTKRGPGSR